MLNLQKKHYFFLIGFLVVANTLAWIAVYEIARPQLLKVVFFDVGQGDSVFIKTPQGHQILIDGGPDARVLEKLGENMPFWDRDIDMLILTHPEQDHVSGLIEVLKRYRVDFVLWTGVLHSSNVYKEWVSLLDEGEAEIIIAHSGKRIRAGDVVLDVLYPFESFSGQNVKNLNNTSVVSRLSFGYNSFLFTGDVYKSVERKLIDQSLKGFLNLNADVLKVGHHGSKTSTLQDFVKTVFPRFAVISAAGNEVEGADCDNKERNKFGHPNCEVLDALGKYDIRILRTDKHGDIEISSDGRNFKVITKK